MEEDGRYNRCRTVGDKVAMNKNYIMTAIALAGIVLLAFGRIPTPFSIILTVLLTIAAYRSYKKAREVEEWEAVRSIQELVEEEQEDD